MARFFAVNALLHLLQGFAQETCSREQVEPDKGGLLLQKNRQAGYESRTSELAKTLLGLRRVMPANSDKIVCQHEFGLCEVLIVFNHVRDDRKIFLEGYRRFFWGVWYAPNDDLTYAINNAMSFYQRVISLLHSTAQSFSSNNSTSDSVLADFTRGRGVPAGVLFPHMDMWFNPHVFRSQPLDLRKMWAPCDKTVAGTCRWFNTADSDFKLPETQSAYMMNQRFRNPGNPNNRLPMLRANMKEANANARAAGILSAHEWQGDNISFSWNDIAYYPRSSWAHLMKLLPHYRSIFHEIAMPTVQDMLVHAHAVEREWLDCAGGCCVEADLKMMSQKVCGHKIRLEKDASRAAMATMLGLPIPAPCEPTC